MTENSTNITTTPRDVFLHLGAIAALYITVISVLTLLFQFINIAFPDPLSGSPDPYSGTIRWAIAALLVMFPVLVTITHYINRDIRKNPDKARMRIKRWLTGLTLFLAGAIIAGDLIAIITSFLGGELTTRFLLKALSVFAVVSVVAGYYIADIRGVWQENARPGWMFAGAVSAGLVAILVTGFLIMGSPQTQRELRFDEQRVQDLQSIQWQVVQFWQDTGELPEDLSALRDDIRGYRAPRDPATDATYEYERTGDLTFELCATFAREGGDQTYGRPSLAPRAAEQPLDVSGEEGVWQHAAGEHCFERTIDPERYSRTQD